MAGTPRQPYITGVVHVVRVARPGDRIRPFNYLISFGGSAEPIGAVHLGKALGTEDLVNQLKKVGVSENQAEAAAQGLAVQEQYEIPDVTLTRGQVYRLGK